MSTRIQKIQTAISHAIGLFSTLVIVVTLIGLLFLSVKSERVQDEVSYSRNKPQMDFARRLNASYHSHLCEPSGDCVLLLTNSSTGTSGAQAWSVRVWCNDQTCQLADIDYTRNGTCQY